MRAEKEFEIWLPKTEQARFIDALLTKGSGVVQDVFANLRIENATAFKPEDAAKIIREVDADVGRHEVSGHAKVKI